MAYKRSCASSNHVRAHAGNQPSERAESTSAQSEDAAQPAMRSHAGAASAEAIQVILHSACHRKLSTCKLMPCRIHAHAHVFYTTLCQIRALDHRNGTP